MNPLNSFNGYLILIVFGIVMLYITKLTAQKHQNKKYFLLADRRIGWMAGAMSIAASWIWAPALFISVQIAYQKGLAGLFWFTVPNVLALMIFAFFAPKIREKFPEGFTLPQYILKRFNDKKLHKIYVFTCFFYQLMAIAVQLYAGGNLLQLITDIPLDIAMPLLLLIGLSYTWTSGFRASVLTDVFQISMIFLIGLIILPLTWTRAGGWHELTKGFKGIESIESIFDPHVAFSFGIVTSIGLIAGALADQQYWQRSFAIQKAHLKKAFIAGGLLFALVPLGLSLLGFFAVSKGFILPQEVDTAMIGVHTITQLLPYWSAWLFLIMLLSGLSSTLDSGLSAASSLWMTDVSAESGIKEARMSMLGIGVLGWLVAIMAGKIPGFGLRHLWWIFNTVAACVLPTTILSLTNQKITGKGSFWGILITLIVGIPLFVYSNIINNPIWIVGSALFVIVISTAFTLGFKRK